MASLVLAAPNTEEGRTAVLLRYTEVGVRRVVEDVVLLVSSVAISSSPVFRLRSIDTGFSCVRIDQ